MQIHHKYPFLLELPPSSIYYSFNNKDYFRYYSPLLIERTCILTIRDVQNIEKTIECTVEEPSHIIKKGSVFAIGGSDKNQEIHQKLIEAAGGADNAYIAFIPAGSANPYAAGMDRLVRFERYCNLPINKNLVPKNNGKFDFSDLQNNSRFWIVPVALIDDDQTNPRPTNDPDHVLNDESTYPDINEATWINGGFSLPIANKLLNGNYNIIFFTGGNQKRYLKTLYNPDGTAGTLMQVILYLYYNKGVILAGTSAGATSLCKTMIVEGHSVNSFFLPPKIISLSKQQNDPEKTESSNGQLLLGKGNGIVNHRIIIDTHFNERNRQTRLLHTLNYFQDHNTQRFGIGIDEDTALIINDQNMKVVGKNSITVFMPLEHNTYKFHILHNHDELKFQENIEEPIIPIAAGSLYQSNKLPQHPLCFFPTYRKQFNNLAIDTFSSNKTDYSLLILLNEKQLYLDEPLSDTFLFILFKLPYTSTYINTQIIHDFGYLDNYFPEIIIHQYETISILNGILKIEPINIIPPNPFADAPTIRTERDFRKLKRSYLSLLCFKYNNKNHLHASFIDYAYIDHYGLLIKTEPCENAEIIHNYAIINHFDNNGFVSFENPINEITIKTLGKTIVHFKNIPDTNHPILLLQKPY